MKEIKRFFIDPWGELIIHRADTSDSQKIRELYMKVYGNKYTLKEVTDPRRNFMVLSNPNNIWLLSEVKGEIVGSVVALTDPHYGIGKLIGAVVLPPYRRYGILKRMMDIIIPEAIKKVDVIYAITRTIDIAPQKTLKRYNFVPLGIFPNVRRLRDYETHLLFANFYNNALEKRVPPKFVITQVKRFLEIIREELPSLEDIPKNDNISIPFSFFSEREQVETLHGDIVNHIFQERQEIDQRDEGVLEGDVKGGRRRTAREYPRQLDFFPFHTPNYYFKGIDWEVFVHFNQEDSHAAIMRISFKTLLDFSRALAWTIRKMDMIGARYLELVIDARYPALHKIAFFLGFLPSAYFPAAAVDKKLLKKGEEKHRVDQVVFSYPLTFPRFTALKLTEEAYKFILAYIQNLNDKLNHDLETIIVFQ